MFRRALKAALFIVCTGLAVCAHAQKGAGQVVYVPTPQVVVETMLRMAKLNAADYLIDLGSGDGRIVLTAAKAYGARALGVDLDRHLLGMANESARKDGVADRARFLEQDLFTVDLNEATVITTYLLPEMNLRLRPKIMALRPGTRVVAHDYHFGDWLPDESATLDVPEKQVGNAGISYVYLWRVPATVSGKWRSQVTFRGVPTELSFDLAQRFQTVSGTVRMGASSAPIRNGHVSGLSMAFEFEMQLAGARTHVYLRGQVDGSAMQGDVTIRHGNDQTEQRWRAAMVSATPREDLAVSR